MATVNGITVRVRSVLDGEKYSATYEGKTVYFNHSWRTLEKDPAKVLANRLCDTTRVGHFVADVLTSIERAMPVRKSERT